MNGLDWLKAIGYVGDDLIEEAQDGLQRPAGGSRVQMKRLLPLAACLCVVIGIGALIARGGFRMGTTSDSSAVNMTTATSASNTMDYDSVTADSAVSDDNASGGVNTGSSMSFMAYDGPVLPLTLAQECDALSAQRTVELDFSPYDGTGGGMIVTDSYLMSNLSDEELTVTACYPIAASLRSLAEAQPEMTQDGEIVSFRVAAGSYAGGFIDTDGSTDGARWNLRNFSSWEQYAELLDDGSDLAAALAGVPVLAQTVTVYELTDTTAPDYLDRAATLALETVVSDPSVTVLSYGFNGLSWDEETGERCYSYTVRHSDEQKLLIVLGGDLDGYVLQGYENGSCASGTEVEGISATVTRYEATLGAMIASIAEESLRSWEVDEAWAAMYFEAYCTAIAELLTNYGALADEPAERYMDCRLDDLVSEAFTLKRVVYLTAEVSIAAGDTAQLCITQTRQGSYDFYTGSANDNLGAEGYDLLQVGSCLNITDQCVSIASYDRVQIMEQTLGFEPETGRTEVPLDDGQMYDYLIVRGIQ